MSAADQATAIVCCTLGPLLLAAVIVGVLLLRESGKRFR